MNKNIKKFAVQDGENLKDFYIHKLKATESVHVFLLLLNCLAHSDVEFTDVCGFEPSVLAAWANLKMQTGLKSDDLSSEDLEKFNNAMNFRRTELIFSILKMALKSLDKNKIDELMSYLVYCVSVDEVTRLATVGDLSIDHHIETPAALLILCREVLEFNFKDFFLSLVLKNFK